MQFIHSGREALVMSIRKKAYIAFFLGAINFFGLLGWTQLFFPRFFWFALIPPVLAGIYTLSLHCPKCGTPIFKKPIKIFGEQFVMWGGLPPRKCQNCGFDLGGPN
jgi:hypothetical protein